MSLLRMTSILMMNRLKSILVIIFLPLLSSCSTPIIIGTALTTVTVSSLREKSLADSVGDATLWANISKSLSQYNLFNSVTVKISDGRVLLTGSVPSIEKKRLAHDLVTRIRGVKSLINRIEVSAINSDQALKDVAILSEIKLAITSASPPINIKNLAVKVTGGAVYITGRIKSEKDYERVGELLKRVLNVREIINYMELE